MTLLTEKFRTGQVTGLATFVRNVAPHLDHLTHEKTPRGLFQCSNGHTFTATIKDSKAPRYCRHCHGGDGFTIKEKIKSKDRLNQLTLLTAAPSFKMTLKAMVDQQNLITEMARAGQSIEFSSIEHIGQMATQYDRKAKVAAPKAKKSYQLIAQVVRQIETLHNEGSPIDAINVRKEVAAVLTK